MAGQPVGACTEEEGLEEGIPSEKLAQLEAMEAPELRSLVLELFEENHRLRNRLSRRVKMLEVSSQELNKAQERRLSISQHAENNLDELQGHVATFLASTSEPDGVVEVQEQEQEITKLRRRLQAEHVRLEDHLKRKEEQCQHLHLCRERTTMLLGQLQEAQTEPNGKESAAAEAPSSSAQPSAQAISQSSPQRLASLEQGRRTPRHAAGTVLPPARPATTGEVWRPPAIIHLTVLIMPGAIIRTASKVMLQVGAMDTPTEVKRRLCEAGVAWGPPDEQHQDAARAARLLFRGMALAPDISLKAQGVGDGSMLRLLPAMGRARLRCGADGMTWHTAAGSAPRGILMNPGTRPWSSANSRGGHEELGQDPHTERAVQEAALHHKSLFAQWPKLATA